MGIISWIIVGALAGWLASMMAGKNSEMGGLANVVIGILGAFIGGLVLRLFGVDGITGFNIWSIIVATLGAFLLLYIVRKIKGVSVEK
ncbi:MAG TPA: GlsB/YeaQ/YmgE family stress response membrane protein [Clostridiales bacterium]|nr:GlsB/YeaQ/YmgE family stress response membrane protein [Clostridiales bacterium]